jgi:long-chain acyl-CoA synthetase
VGTPLHNVTVKILDPDTKQERPADTDGEICVAGPSVMTGYRNNPQVDHHHLHVSIFRSLTLTHVRSLFFSQANDEVFFQKDGKKFFRTGDLGRMVEGKFLKVTGRIKEQYKLENGKYVVPAPLEDAMTRSLYIAQVCTITT